jgi:hypothetical protein
MENFFNNKYELDADTNDLKFNKLDQGINCRVY